MKLDRVTITGADDSVNVGELLPISQQYPFVEWGILVSESNSKGFGSARFPSPRWFTDLQGIAETTGELKLSLHMCGRWVRELLLGNVTFPTNLLHCFQRVQLNFHAERTQCEPVKFAEALRVFDGRPIIFQLDGAKGNDHMDSAGGEEVGNCFGLFDVSGGAGIVPEKWPEPVYIDVTPRPHGSGVQSPAYHGYAGGLAPHNLQRELPLIANAAGDCRIWIDMETRVRSHGDYLFDLVKVRQALEMCRPWIVTEMVAAR